MKIFTIFEGQLYAFQYKNEDADELSRLLALWNNTAYLYEFVKINKADIPERFTIKQIVNQLIKNAEEIDDALYEIFKNPTRSLEEFFSPLHNLEYQIVELSMQKGRKQYLRLYAIKIDTNCFIITGGAIKFHHLNKDRPHTQEEMIKLNRCRDFLKDNDIFDDNSFYEFLNEQS